MVFSYSLIDSDETRAIYDQMLAADTAKVLEWRGAREQRKYLPVDALFAAWWFQNGPTAFVSGSDAARYRRELLAVVKEKLMADGRDE